MTDQTTPKTIEYGITDRPVKDSINLLKTLVSFEDILRISVKSDWEGLKQTLFHSFCILFSGILLMIGFHLTSNSSVSILEKIFFWCAMLLHAFFISFLFMPLHEATHRTAFKSVWANKVLAWVTGFLTLRPPIYYLVYHFPHHHYTGDPKRDPELLDSLIDLKLTTLKDYLMFLSGIPFWMDRVLTTSRLITGKVTEPWVKLEKNKQAIVWEARYLTVLYFLLFVWSLVTGSTFLWYYWILPSLLAQPFLRFYLITEHTGCQQTLNMMENTRTTYTNWFYRQLAWNMPWHAEHHAFPQVPFYSLGKAHELVKSASVEKTGCKPSGKNGYIAVNRGILENMQISKKDITK